MIGMKKNSNGEESSMLEIIIFVEERRERV